MSVVFVVAVVAQQESLNLLGNAGICTVSPVDTHPLQGHCSGSTNRDFWTYSRQLTTLCVAHCCFVETQTYRCSREWCTPKIEGLAIEHYWTLWFQRRLRVPKFTKTPMYIFAHGNLESIVEWCSFPSDRSQHDPWHERPFDRAQCVPKLEHWSVSVPLLTFHWKGCEIILG